MCHVTSALTNQRRVFKLCLTQTKRVSDDVTRKIGPLDFIDDLVIHSMYNRDAKKTI